MSEADTLTLTIDAPDTTDELVVPTRLLELVAEDDESAPEVVGDTAMITLANQIHHTVAHAEGTGEGLEDVEAHTMELFEERFGESFAEMTGHEH
ncbi:hypothetical protein BRC90_05015 [Halobacteriales archaeon QS_4_69_34]|nr:MAG: hypothetical protein BRC90_05015 [Halobacteriales archaeon QS_4_69_34]